MGKRVFEVAKELGMDHRELMNRCDQFRIDVKNYMSVISDADAARLKTAIEAERKPVAVEERVNVPGAVRVRRSRRSTDEKASRPPVLKPAPAPVRRAARRAATPEPPAAERETPVAPEQPEQRPEAAAEPPAEARPAAEQQPAEARPTAEQQPSEAPPAEGAEAAQPPAETAEQAPAEPAQPEASRPAEARPAEARPAPARAAARSERPKEAAPGARTRPKEEGEEPGRAKVLGRISIEELRNRTQRGLAGRTGPGARRPPGRGAGPAPRRGPGGARPAAMPAAGPAFPPPPSGRADRRRKESDRDVERGRPSGRGKKRQVFSREDLYASAARQPRGRKRKAPSRKGAKTQLTTPAAHKRVIRIDGTISVGELGKEMGVKANELLAKLMQMGMMVTINEQLDRDTAAVLASDYEYEVQDISFSEEEVLSGPVEEEALAADPDAEPRAPVVTIMGHVDHGKTTLLDRIRSSNVADAEAGGITQHIGAYKVTVGDGHVVFLDTPGHEAFTAMRARGAQVTDVVLLVVAADDGVMPQTVEAINHAKAAGVPLVVAINKIDKPGADPDRVKQELTKYELVPEEWGGDILYVPISALTGKGVDDLLESLALQTEILELRANPKKPAYGHVVEARVDKGRGPVATVLVQEGTLKRGDYVVAGAHFGRVRAMLDDRGRQLKAAGPSTPVEVLGLDGVPPAGETFHVVPSEKDAKRVVETRLDRERQARAATRQTPADLLALMKQQPAQEVNLIIKADVQGSLEAIRAAVEQLGTDEVSVKIVHAGVGAISESDVTLAQTAEATILGFNVGPDTQAKRLASQAEVEIRRYSVIYELLDGVKGMLSGLLAPEVVENPLGKAEVRAVFRISRVGTIAGSYVLEGKVARNAQARVVRDGEVVHQGRVSGLKRFKEDVREVTFGYECGISVDGYDDVREGDILEVFEVKEVRRELT